MKITVKYTEYAGEMDRAPKTVSGSYNAEQKTIDIIVKDEEVEYFRILGMTDEQMMAFGKEKFGDAFRDESVAENRKALLDYFRGVYGWSDKVTMAIAKHF